MSFNILPSYCGYILVYSNKMLNMHTVGSNMLVSSKVNYNSNHTILYTCSGGAVCPKLAFQVKMAKEYISLT